MSTFTSVSQILAELNRVEYVDLPLSINFVANDLMLDPEVDGSIMYDLCDHLSAHDTPEFNNLFGNVEPVDWDVAFDGIINGNNKWGFRSGDFEILSNFYTQLRSERRMGIISEDQSQELMGQFMHVFMLMKKIDINNSMMILAMPTPGQNSTGVVGTCIAQVDKKSREMRLMITVDEEIRNQGLGTSFLKKALKYAAQMDVSRIYMNGISNDPCLLHIAEKQDLNVVYSGGQISGNRSITIIDKALSE